MRRHGPEPLWDGPQIKHTPGLAVELLRELAPLLAEDGIIINPDGDIVGDLPDLQTLQHALDRAVERQNLALFTPIGHARDLATAVLRQVSIALAVGATTTAAAVLEHQVVPASPDGRQATVAGCTGVALGLLDHWLHDHTADTAPSGLAGRIRLPAGHWIGERAATDILGLAAKGRAFRSLDTLTHHHGGHHLLYGSTLALTATVHTWAEQTTTDPTELATAIIR